MRKKAGSFGSQLFWGLYFTTAAVILALVLLRDSFTYWFNRVLPLPDWLLLLAALAAILAGTAVIRRFREPLGKRFSGISPAWFFFFFFLAQVYICYNCYFESGWDVMLVVNYARQLADGFLLNLEQYFQKYENNILITVLFSLFIRLSRYVGILDVEQSLYMAIITAQCALSSLTGWLVYRCSLRLWKRRAAAWAVALFYCGLVGLSPWMMIPYSDAMGLVVPTLVLSLYLSMEDRRRLPLKWAALAALGYWGYRIKPQCAICAIAVLALEVWKLLREAPRLRLPELRRRGLSVLSAAAAFCLSALLFSQALLPAAGVIPDKNKAFGPAHFFMMGLNDETDGTYNANDVAFSSSFKSGDERTREDMKVALRRIADYGPGGLLRHLAEKTLVNFGDGTFAWSFEGNFYLKLTEPKNRFISPLLRAVYYRDGPYFSLFTCFEQALWLFVLAAPLGLLADREAREDRALRMLALSVLGLTLFETLFEARARYLYIYAPYFILLAAAGWKSLLARLRTLRRKT